MEADIGRMEEQLSQWGARLDELIASVGEAGATAKRDTERRLDDLRAKHQDARSKIVALRSLGSESWETIKAGVESAWVELEVAFRELSVKP